MEQDIVERLADLHVQATRERSHYYTGKLIKEAAATIMDLRQQLADLKFKHNEMES